MYQDIHKNFPVDFRLKIRSLNVVLKMGIGIISILLLLTFPSQSFANDAKDVEQFINKLGKNIIEIADDEKLNVVQKRDKLVNLVDSVIDSKWISKFVLGKYYRRANDSQKEKFKQLYREFMIHTYSPKFTGYNGEKFEVINIINQSNYYTAKCLFYPKDDSPAINLNFRVKKNTYSADPKFLVFDIIAEGVSLIETQRSEFGSVISREGMDKFLKDLQERIKNLKIENAKPNPKHKDGKSKS